MRKFSEAWWTEHDRRARRYNQMMAAREARGIASLLRRARRGGGVTIDEKAAQAAIMPFLQEARLLRATA